MTTKERPYIARWPTSAPRCWLVIPTARSDRFVCWAFSRTIYPAGLTALTRMVARDSQPKRGSAPPRPKPLMARTASYGLGLQEHRVEAICRSPHLWSPHAQETCSNGATKITEDKEIRLVHNEWPLAFPMCCATAELLATGLSDLFQVNQAISQAFVTRHRTSCTQKIVLDTVSIATATDAEPPALV